MVDQTGLAVAIEPFSPDPKVRPAGASPGRLAVLANEATAACGGCACIIEWRTPQGIGRIEKPEEVRWRTALGAVSQIIARRAEHTPRGASIVLAAEEIAAVAGHHLTGGTAVGAVACTTTEAENAVVITLLAARGHPLDQIEAVARLTGHAALAIVAAEEAAASRDFWRDRASQLGEQLGQLKAEAALEAAERTIITNLVAASARLPVGQRWPRLVEALAGAGYADRCDGWLIATHDRNELRIVATAEGWAANPPRGALLSSEERLRRQSPRARQPEHSSVREITTSATAYLTLSLGACAITLAPTGGIDPSGLARLERMTTRLAPIVRLWMAEEDSARLHDLARNLGARMYAAADGERLRIARDLHDGQAQLLAAARITLEADPAKARGMLRQLDEALRSLVRDLRPTTLGRAKLATVLSYEINRLHGAGIKGRIRHLERTKTLPPSLQQLCYQVVREAVSNVIRHAGATRAELSFERHEGWVRLQVDDNGIRMDQQTPATQSKSRGLGLAGMTERLELMGGTLKLERLDGITRLIAEIPTA